MVQTYRWLGKSDYLWRDFLPLLPVHCYPLKMAVVYCACTRPRPVCKLYSHHKIFNVLIVNTVSKINFYKLHECVHLYAVILCSSICEGIGSLLN